MSITETTRQQVSGIRTALSHLLLGCNVSVEVLGVGRRAEVEQRGAEEPVGLDHHRRTRRSSGCISPARRSRASRLRVR